MRCGDSDFTIFQYDYNRQLGPQNYGPHFTHTSALTVRKFWSAFYPLTSAFYTSPIPGVPLLPRTNLNRITNDFALQMVCPNTQRCFNNSLNTNVLLTGNETAKICNYYKKTQHNTQQICRVSSAATLLFWNSQDCVPKISKLTLKFPSLIKNEK